MGSRIPVYVCLAVAAVLLMLPGGCGDTGQPAEMVKATTAGDREALTAGPKGQELRVGVSPIVSPGEAFPAHRDVRSYLETCLGRPVRILYRRTYAEVSSLLRFGQLDAAFVCSYLYVLGSEDYDLAALVVPVVGGETVYHSYIIVPASSPARTLEDLRGREFAFCDLLSNTGRLAPQYALAQLGESPETFFSRTMFTYSHDRAVRAVAMELVDGAGVDSLVYEAMVAEDPDLRRSLRVIQRLGPFGMPPVVVGPRIDPEMKEHLRGCFLSMHEDSAGLRALEGLEAERFVPADSSAYESIREMARALGELP